MEKILIVEDELIVARDIRKTLERNGYKVAGVARTAEKALSMIAEERPSLVLVDIFLKGDLTGIDLAAQLNNENIPFIYVSANSNQLVLEAAKTTNPYGFIVKPFREKDLLVTIDIARYRYENNRQISQAIAGSSQQPLLAAMPAERANQRRELRTGFCEGIVGVSAGMLRVFNLIQQVAAFDTSVLLLGESGTGKEVVANCIFQQSKRNNKPFIKINCAAIPASLMEAEFFGYEKGAFTGASERKTGKFELASGGTILLDEIGEMPIDMQVKLLRAIQEKEIQRIGSAATIKTDMRIIAATSRNLEKEVGEGRFRLDLYYRLHVFPITLPPLRERKEDIPLIAAHFMKYYANATGKNIRAINERAMQLLLNYHWPGNIRELQHLMERSVLLTQGDTIHEITLPADAMMTAGHQESNLEKTGDEIEKLQILSALRQCNFRIAGKNGAAELLGIPPTTLYSKIKRLGIKIEHV